MCKWSGEEEQWDSKTNTPGAFPYHKDQLEQQMTGPSTPRSKKQAELIKPLPDVVTKRLCLPFEFRFTNQDVSQSFLRV